MTFETLEAKQTLGRVIRIVAAILATIAAVVWIFYGRQRLPHFAQPLPYLDLSRFELNPYFVGVQVTSIITPLALIYLFSRTPIFRKIVTEEPLEHCFLKLFGWLVLIQFLALNYELGLFFPNPDKQTLGLLVVMLAGLLGGWRMGLGMGIITMVMIGTKFLIEDPNIGEIFQAVYREDGPQGFVRWLWGDLFFFAYLFNLRASSAVWAGAISGLSAEVLRKHRFSPPVLLFMGILIDAGAGGLILLGSEYHEETLLVLIPSALISGLVMVVIGLMARSVQAEAEQRKAEAVRHALTQAELRALRAQINPHFLFNTLNTIRYFVRTEPETARRLLLDLSEIFQRALRAGELVSLRDEIGYVESYLALEQARLGERLRVDWYRPAIQDPLLEHAVPTLILQPLVENAVIHGIAPKPEGGRLQIMIKLVDDDLLMRVEDDGVGIDPARLDWLLNQADDQETSSIGLRNVDRRLRSLYGDDGHLVITSRPSGGTRAEIKIPGNPVQSVPTSNGEKI